MQRVKDSDLPLSCDTMVAVGDSGGGGQTILAKNSDRQRGGLFEGVDSISNIYSTEYQWDEISCDAIDFAVSEGWAQKHHDFSFARAYTDTTYHRLAGCQARYARSQNLLNQEKNPIEAVTFFGVLRDHYEDSFLAPRWSADEALLQRRFDTRRARRCRSEVLPRVAVVAVRNADTSCGDQLSGTLPRGAKAIWRPGVTFFAGIAEDRAKSPKRTF